MSFFNKFKTPAGQSAGLTTAKKNQEAHPSTLLEQRLIDATGPVRPDGSDKFFGFENYGSTCYCNSIMQCLYYSAPFRENVLNFPSKAFLEDLRSRQPNGTFPTPQTISTTSYPNLTSPARKPPAPTSPGGMSKPEESKDSPEFRKRQAITVGPVLDMVQDNSSKYGMNESLFTSLRDIFEAIIGNSSRVGVVSPHRFMEILKRENEMFRGAAHQDAHEFLNLLLNQVMDSVEMLARQHPDAFPAPIMDETKAIDMAVTTSGLQLSTKAVDSFWVRDLFEGHLTSETRCLTCETASQRDEAFLDISVDLEAHGSVTSCLRKFSEEEMLCERNKFHCDNCGGLQEAEKRMKIKRLPRILALHLKRFKYTEDQQRLQKLFHRVNYPFHLRLFNTTDDAEDPDRLYELYAVVVHIGSNPYHGHYISVIKTQDRGWLLFDDEMVEPVDKSYILNFFGGEPVPHIQDPKQYACAYVLFYQETTVEAVLREQEAELQQASIRISDIEASKESASSPILHQSTTIIPPLPEDLPYLEKLTHSLTAPHVPILTAPVRPPISHSLTNPFSSNGSINAALKSKREEKERKAEEKARQKADEKFSKQQVQTQMYTTSSAIVDDERDSATTSTTDSNGPASSAAAVTVVTAAPTKEKESSFSRFKAGSMSLRKGRNRLFSSSKDKNSVAIPLLSNGNGNTDGGGGLSSPFATDDGNGVTALPAAVNGNGSANGNVQATTTNGEAKKGRFSMMKKKTAIT